jgi:proteasome accessory factor C
MNVADRINRILLIMSYVSQNQGIWLDDLAKKVEMRPQELLKELEFMLLIGKPPFRPDDYVDIYVEDRRVFIEFDQMLNRPLRFTRPEAVALLVSLQLLDPEVDPEAVRSLKSKIRQAIARSEDSRSRIENRVVVDRPSRPVSEHFALLRQAVEDQLKVRIDYYSLTRNETLSRNVRPYYLMKRLGYWYMEGYCELRRDVRTFKFDRVLAVDLLKDSFSLPEGVDVRQDRNNFLRFPGDREIRVFFDADVAPWIKEQWGDSVEPGKDGGVVLTLESETLEFPSRLVLQFARHARPLSPPELIEKVRSDARKVLDLYDTPVSAS